MGPTSMPSVPLMVGCGVSCTALLILLLIYAAFWRYPDYFLLPSLAALTYYPLATPERFAQSAQLI